MDERKLEQSVRAWLAGRLCRKDIPDLWEILEYRGHVQEALREDTRGTLLVYARALLPYAEGQGSRWQPRRNEAHESRGRITQIHHSIASTS